jgi:hypothetical protein
MLRIFFLDDQFVWGVPFLLLGFFQLKKYRQNVALAGLVIIYFFFFAYVGGENDIHFRLLVPMLAPFMILSASGIHEMVQVLFEKRRKFIFQFSFCCFVLFILFFYKVTHQNIYGEGPALRSPWILAGEGLLQCPKRFYEQINSYATNYNDYYYPFFGLWIKKSFPRGIWIALDQMGQVPYFAGINYKFIDVLGLTDQYIGRRLDVSQRSFHVFSRPLIQGLKRLYGKADSNPTMSALISSNKNERHKEIIRYILGKHPEMIMFMAAFRNKPYLKKLLIDPDFKEHYVLAQIFGWNPELKPNDDANDTLIFLRTDIAGRLAKRKYKFIFPVPKFYHFTEKDEVRNWVKKICPDLLGLTT